MRFTICKTEKAQVWIVELRAGDGAQATVAHVASSLELARAWCVQYPPEGSEWLAISRDVVDGPIVQDHQMEFWGPCGQLVRQPVDGDFQYQEG